MHYYTHIHTIHMFTHIINLNSSERKKRHFSSGRRTSLTILSTVVRQFCCTSTSVGGVDRGDQLHGYYACTTKSRKSNRYTFYFLFDVAITNAHILQKNFCPKNVHKNVKGFRLQLAQELMGDLFTAVVAGHPRLPHFLYTTFQSGFQSGFQMNHTEKFQVRKVCSLQFKSQA